uniref:Uncharacterized protein n=1 Tax=Rhizophora mucronata TaxID=61149 RepID=A0A2P2PLA9_RHIMU
MCPLRLILIFLSATLAGFFVIRNLKSSPLSDAGDLSAGNSIPSTPSSDSASSSSSFSTMNQFSKVRSGITSVFWIGVDMASGRYLWRHLASLSSKRSS